jgi:hypothetical protein
VTTADQAMMRRNFAVTIAARGVGSASRSTAMRSPNSRPNTHAVTTPRASRPPTASIWVRSVK